MIHWFHAALILAPLLAGIAALGAAAVTTAQTRQAWARFGHACMIWTLSAIFWAWSAVNGALPLSVAAGLMFFLSCGLFVSGVFRYTSESSTFGRIHGANFGLAICSILATGLAFYATALLESEIGTLGLAVAFFYPAFWLSAAVFGLISVTLYTPKGRRGPLLIIVAAIGAHGIGNLLFGQALLNGDFRFGAPWQGLWVLGFAFVIWAALEQIRRQRRGRAQPEAYAPTRIRPTGEALIPALSTGPILVSAYMAQAEALGPVLLALLPIAILFAGFLGFREFSLLSVESRLRREAEQIAADLAASRREIDSVLLSTTDSVVVLDREFHVTYVNEHARRLLTTRRELEVGMNCWEVFPEMVGGSIEANLTRALEEPVEFEEYIPLFDRWLEIHCFPSPQGISIFFRDITERRAAQQELKRLARHDPLTNLANRTLFNERLKEALQDRRRPGELAILSLDLDGFKDVNDTMGHAAGDVLLQQFADRLTRLVREEDTVARLGGDEFAIIQTGPIKRHEAAVAARRITEALTEPFMVDECDVRLGASIGVALAPDNGSTPENLLKCADIALYKAKAQEGDMICIYEEGMDHQVHSRQRLRMDLRTALDEDQFELVYQPIVRLTTGEIARFEALLRWRHPTRGLVSPVEFIPVAEETGLIAPIGEWVLRRACQDARAWPEDVSLAVNLSAAQLKDEGLLEKVQSALADAGIAPERLEFEVTESVLLREGGQLETLQALRDLGVRIALDDFGTGYSSLGYLRRFAFDRIKIDRSFVGDLPDSLDSSVIVRAVAELGAALGIETTAEGIETTQQFEALRAEGCQEAQGYLFSRPVPAAEAQALLKRENLLNEPAPRPKLLPAA